LQLVLVELWHEATARGARDFTRDDFNRIGGLAGAAGRYAERVFEALAAAPGAGPDAPEVARRIFNRLSRWTGRDAYGRTVVPLRDVWQANDQQSPARVLDHFAASRLISLERTAGNDVVALEFVPLLSKGWKRLQWGTPEPLPVPVRPEAYSILRVREVPRGDQGEYQFDLYERGSGTVREFRLAHRIGYARQELQQVLAHEWRGLHKNKQFEHELLKVGLKLTYVLLPRELQFALLEMHHLARNLQVVGEPQIPWEILSVRGTGSGPPDKTGIFLGELGLVRWLADMSSLPPVLDRRPGPLRVLIAGADGGRQAAGPVGDLWRSPVVNATVLPDADALLNRLHEPDSFDLLYLVAGCSVDKFGMPTLLLPRASGTGGAEGTALPLNIMMMDWKLTGPSQTRPMVFLDAMLSDSGGDWGTVHSQFARAFLRAGAGAFVGNFLPVEDRSRGPFARAFFSALLAGETLINATLRARRATRAEGDPGWLSYAVYGQPDTRLAVELPEPRPKPAPPRTRREAPRGKKGKRPRGPSK
jgi:hypothetical protein